MNLCVCMYSLLHSSEASVSEILLTGLGENKTFPHLMAIMDNDLVVYSAFTYCQQNSPGHLCVRFSKVRREGGRIN